ncbi:MAG: hypothetical protein WCI43_00475 [Candidatus Firestonebacteria bacterium]
MEKKFILVTGGARSGKSGFSEELGKNSGVALFTLPPWKGVTAR